MTMDLDPHGRFLLVKSHPRSGTHLLIDTLLKNLTDAVFPRMRPSFSSLENLLLPYDREVIKTWKQYIKSEDHEVKIFKTHLLEADIDSFLNAEGLSSLQKTAQEIVRLIRRRASTVYVYRDGRDVLVSLFEFLKSGSPVLSNYPRRTEHLDFGAFIRMPNDFILPFRGFESFDRNRVSYWDYHVSSHREDVPSIRFKALKDEVEESLSSLIGRLGLEEQLKGEIQPVTIEEARDEPFLRESLNRGKKFAKKICPPFLWETIKAIKDQQKDPIQETTISAVNPRKGKTGGWEEYFLEEDLRWYRQETERGRNLSGS